MPENNTPPATAASCSDAGLALARTQKQACLKWSHPDWDGHLITGPNDHDIAQDYLGDDIYRNSLLTSEPVEMSQEELDALPEFEG